MAVNMHGQVVVQTTAPGEAPVKVGTLWSDTTLNLVKVCTSISPYTFVILHGGAVDAAEITSGTLAVARGGTGANNTTQQYTPTMAAVANTTAIVTSPNALYFRVGSIVHVSGTITLTPTAGGTLSTFTATLPIASNIGNTNTDLHGVFAGPANMTVGASGSIRGDVAGDLAFFEITQGDGSARVYHYVYQYIVL